jgi:hypothetical protein
VSTKHLNEQVRRNLARFPADFMFRLTENEFDFLRSQFATSKEHKGGRRYVPHVFTEHGLAMLSSVLHSERAIHVNIDIIRAFARLRELLATHKDLARKLEDLERKYDVEFKIVFEAIRQLIKPPEKPKRQIACPPSYWRGFQVKEPYAPYSKRRKHWSASQKPDLSC